jgi:hypothetical protein
MDVTTVKNILGITTTKHDTYLTKVIPLIVEYAKDECYQDFLDDDGVEQLPGGVKVFVAKAIEYNMNTAGVTSRSQGVSYSYDTDFPKSIMRFLSPYRRLKW